MVVITVNSSMHASVQHTYILGGFIFTTWCAAFIWTITAIQVRIVYSLQSINSSCLRRTLWRLMWVAARAAAPDLWLHTLTELWAATSVKLKLLRPARIQATQPMSHSGNLTLYIALETSIFPVFVCVHAKTDRQTDRHSCTCQHFLCLLLVTPV